ncbi:MAG: hypothetical protein ACPGWR_00800 [Ardenticatenaceae bacterium]
MADRKKFWSHHLKCTARTNSNASAALTDLLAQVGLGRAIILMAYANKNAYVAIKMMALPRESLELG